MLVIREDIQEQPFKSRSPPEIVLELRVLLGEFRISGLVNYCGKKWLAITSKDVLDADVNQLASTIVGRVVRGLLVLAEPEELGS